MNNFRELLNLRIFFFATDSEMFPSSTSSLVEGAAHIAGGCGSTRGALDEPHRFGKVSRESGRQIASIDRDRDDEHNTASLDLRDFVVEREDNNKLIDRKAIGLLTRVLCDAQVDHPGLWRLTC